MEALVWNTRLRMQRGVGVAGNGVSLLNGQTTRRDSKLRRRREGLFAFNKAGVKDKEPRSQVDLGHVSKIFRESIRGFHDFLRQKPPSLLILYSWSSISMAPITTRFIYLVFVARMEKLWD
jgi:hypothetical protein